MRAYAPAVSIQKLLAIVLAVALLFAPAMSRAGEAFAAMPDHHAQMLASGHCKEAPSNSTDDYTSSDRDCCMSMCMAVAVAPGAPSEAAQVHGGRTTFPATKRYHGCIAEIATPPPRLA